jgi:hypothetical protein
MLLKKMKVVSFLVLVLLGTTVSADCSGYLQILEIGSRTAGDEVVIIVRTNESNINRTRTLDLTLYNPLYRPVTTLQTVFDENQGETFIEARLDTDNFVNGSYQIKADMRVYNKVNGSENLDCGKIVYSNFFYVHSNRINYQNAPLKFDLDYALPTQRVFYTQQDCYGGLCAILNVSGDMPYNVTLLPEFNMNPLNRSYNVSLAVNPTITYDIVYVRLLAEALANESLRSGVCFDRVVNMSQEYSGCVADKNSLEAKRSECSAALLASEKEYSDYKLAHPYEPMNFGGLCFVGGAVGFYVFMFIVTRRQSGETPADKV